MQKIFQSSFHRDTPMARLHAIFKCRIISFQSSFHRDSVRETPMHLGRSQQPLFQSSFHREKLKRVRLRSIADYPFNPLFIETIHMLYGSHLYRLHLSILFSSRLGEACKVTSPSYFRLSILFSSRLHLKSGIRTALASLFQSSFHRDEKRG